MNLLAQFIFIAADAPAPAPQSSPGISPIGMIIVFIIIMVFMFIFNPQRSAEKKRRKMLEALQKGDKVITIGGIYGVVSQIKESEIILIVSENVKMTFSRGAIREIIPPEEKAKEETKK